MTYRGIAKGKVIELEDTLPFPNGQSVTVQIETTENGPLPGSAARILSAIHEPPHLSCADVDELENQIAAGRLPVQQRGPFDNGK